ncbi:hypothetical protein KDA_01740 [Dictyobacter alpinus]|uniref:Uncharacterized protein n=1 Tax=Dictyobacter alpinus TaxID=2014873 RepID=A0A402B022_9CHLR|nr:hypothetical protein [Dictyobacter alpinus]GCE24690.1 hypothetical protein KDA_01740 [Dictyobacter alpinus]
MAFTQDELQSLNTIMEQKLLVQRRELERTFDLRLQAMRREFEQRVITLHHDLLHTVSQRLNDQHTRTHEVIQQKIDSQQTTFIQALEHAFELHQQQQQQVYEDTIEHALAAQLLAIEQMMQRSMTASANTEFATPYTIDGQPEFDTIEVQAEIPWEELAVLVDQALEGRVDILQKTVLAALKELGQTLQVQIKTLQLSLSQASISPATDTLYSSHESAAATQHTAKSIERLEELIEAMQVAMTSNSALISNRLYHHQQLPLERAHPTQDTRSHLSDLSSYHTYPSVPEPVGENE